MPDDPKPNPQSSGETPSPDTNTPGWATELGANVKALTGGITELLNFSKQRAQELKQQEQQQQQAEGEEETEEEATPSGNDLETMSRAEFASYIGREIMKQLNKEVVQPLGSQVQATQNQMVARETAREVGELMAKHPDYWDWKDEMLSLARENPTLSTERLYRLARSEDPAKVTELEKKYKKASGEDEEKGEGTGKKRVNGRAQNFGGIAPSGRGSQSANRKMGSVEAALSAWDQVVSETGRPDFLAEE